MKTSNSAAFEIYIISALVMCNLLEIVFVLFIQQYLTVYLTVTINSQFYAIICLINLILVQIDL